MMLKNREGRVMERTGIERKPKDTHYAVLMVLRQLPFRAKLASSTAGKLDPARNGYR